MTQVAVGKRDYQQISNDLSNSHHGCYRYIAHVGALLRLQTGLEKLKCRSCRSSPTPYLQCEPLPPLMTPWQITKNNSLHSSHTTVRNAERRRAQLQAGSQGRSFLPL